MMDFEVQRCTRHCAVSGRDLSPGETIYSCLVSQGAKVDRLDYAADQWTGPPPAALGWWKSQIPKIESKKAHWAPNDVMLELLEQLATQPEQQDLRYVLALLLVRRRVVRLEDTHLDERGHEISTLVCPRSEAVYEVAVVMPSEPRVAEIQQMLSDLLFTGPADAPGKSNKIPATPATQPG